MTDRAQLLYNLHRAAHNISDIDVFTAKLLLDAARYIEQIGEETELENNDKSVVEYRREK